MHGAQLHGLTQTPWAPGGCLHNPAPCHGLQRARARAAAALLVQPLAVRGYVNCSGSPSARQRAGVLFNVLFPEWLQTALLVVLLGVVVKKTAGKGVKQWQQEQKAKEAAAEAGPVPCGHPHGPVKLDHIFRDMCL